LIGRQTVIFHHLPSFIDLLHSHGTDTGQLQPEHIRTDTRTINRLPGGEGNWMADTDLCPRWLQLSLTGWFSNGPGRGGPIYRSAPARCIAGRWSYCLSRELVRREIVEARMWTHFVVQVDAGTPTGLRSAKFFIAFIRGVDA
jgi:hypothetical protein